MWLLMAEFAENANESVETGHSLFFTNFEYESRMKFNTMKVFDPQSIQKRIDQGRIQTMLR